MEKNKLEIAIEKAQNLLKFFTEKQIGKFDGVKVVDSDEMVDYSALEVGADVQISTSTGSATAPDGDYKLVNGVEFTVKDGKIDTISSTGDSADDSTDDEDMAKAPVAPAAPAKTDAPVEAPAKPEAPKTQAPASGDTAAISDLTNRVSQLKQAVQAIMEAIQAVPSKEDMSAFRNELVTVNEAIITLSKTPTQLSADSRVEVQETQLEKYSRIANAFKK